MVEPPRCSERYTNYLSIIYMYTQRSRHRYWLLTIYYIICSWYLDILVWSLDCLFIIIHFCLAILMVIQTIYPYIVIDFCLYCIFVISKHFGLESRLYTSCLAVLVHSSCLDCLGTETVFMCVWIPIRFGFQLSMRFRSDTMDEQERVVLWKSNTYDYSWKVGNWEEDVWRKAFVSSERRVEYGGFRGCCQLNQTESKKNYSD